MRESIKWFAERMEDKLKENDFKDGWKQGKLRYFFSLLMGEIDELDSTIPLNEDLLTSRSLDIVIEECCDVANFVMMIADNAKRLKGEEQ